MQKSPLPGCFAQQIVGVLEGVGLRPGFSDSAGLGHLFRRELWGVSAHELLCSGMSGGGGHGVPVIGKGTADFAAAPRRIHFAQGEIGP